MAPWRGGEGCEVGAGGGRGGRGRRGKGAGEETGEYHFIWVRKAAVDLGD